MSKKATSNARSVSKALSKSASEARLLSEAKRLPQDAVKAAVAAACAAMRADGTKDTTPVRGVAKDARAAAEEAVAHAREAIEAADQDDPVGAALAANRATVAAQRTASLSAAVSVIVGTSQAEAAGKAPGAPSDTPKRREESPREARERELAALIDRSASYLVTYDHRVIATFAREEDAFLLESELAELDCERGVASAMCEVLDRRTGHRLGGYMLTSGRIHVFLRDEDHEARFDKRRR